MPAKRKPVKADCDHQWWLGFWRKSEARWRQPEDNPHTACGECPKCLVTSRLRAVLAGPCGGRCMDDSEDVEATLRVLMKQFEIRDQA